MYVCMKLSNFYTVLIATSVTVVFMKITFLHLYYFVYFQTFRFFNSIQFYFFRCSFLTLLKCMNEWMTDCLSGVSVFFWLINNIQNHLIWFVCWLVKIFFIINFGFLFDKGEGLGKFVVVIIINYSSRRKVVLKGICNAYSFIHT